MSIRRPGVSPAAATTAPCSSTGARWAGAGPYHCGRRGRGAWTVFSRAEKAGKARQCVGLWHEAYVVPEESYESDLDRHAGLGLAAAHGRVLL
ncbi:hypothetical protein ACFVP3_27170 [Streptomyces sp. NPDC057806]|uniref:hypothetical protein n=1 Tax=Streptomyces sp. NPDC057806 TaxID=3346255 RepID=UPI003677ABC3